MLIFAKKKEWRWEINGWGERRDRQSVFVAKYLKRASTRRRVRRLCFIHIQRSPRKQVERTDAAVEKRGGGGERYSRSRYSPQSAYDLSIFHFATHSECRLRSPSLSFFPFFIRFQSPSSSPFRFSSTRASPRSRLEIPFFFRATMTAIFSRYRMHLNHRAPFVRRAIGRSRS